MRDEYDARLWQDSHQQTYAGIDRLIEIVMQALFALDHVAYVRFASVYQDFQDVEAFRRQIEQMQQKEH